MMHGSLSGVLWNYIVAHERRAVLKCFPPQFAWETHDSCMAYALVKLQQEIH